MKETVCTGCSLLCDDIAYEYINGEFKSHGLCRLGHNYFETALKQTETNHSSLPIDDTIEKAAEILVSAKQPLCYGWTSSTNETIKEGLALTRTLGGFFDTPSSLGLSKILEHTLHSKGLEIDLDGVRNRAETVVFWGTNPAESSQRLIGKYAVLPRGDKIPEGVESRTVAVIDVRRTETMKIANHQIILDPNSDTAFAEAVIGELSKSAPIKNAVGKTSAAELIGFSKNLQKSDCTIFFYGSGLTNSGNFEPNLQALNRIIQLLRESGSEAYALPVTIDCNTMGAIEVCRKVTGFPNSVDFSNGKVEYNPTITAHQKLISGDFDAALIVGDDSIFTSPRPVTKSLTKIPTVYIGPQRNTTNQKVTISLLSAENGVFCDGVMNRMDQREITLLPIDDSSLPFLSELDLVSKIHQNVKNNS